jgi:hypothetical protein
MESSNVFLIQLFLMFLLIFFVLSFWQRKVMNSPLSKEDGLTIAMFFSFQILTIVFLYMLSFDQVNLQYLENILIQKSPGFNMFQVFGIHFLLVVVFYFVSFGMSFILLRSTNIFKGGFLAVLVERNLPVIIVFSTCQLIIGCLFGQLVVREFIFNMISNSVNLLPIY